VTELQAALAPGEVVWVTPDPTIGREQGGRRPALVIAGNDYLATVDTLAIVVPITTVDRNWPNHIPIVGTDLPERSWAMTEQVRTISRERIVTRAGSTDVATLREVRDWVRDFLDL
jgi:mRNA interferase MazF